MSNSVQEAEAGPRKTAVEQVAGPEYNEGPIPSGPLAGSTADSGALQARIALSLSMVIAVQNAVEMVRNVSTVEVTTIGAANARWLADPEGTAWEPMVERSLTTIGQSVEILERVVAMARTALQPEGSD